MRRRRIHLINPMEQVGGSEYRTLDLYKVLKGSADVTIWSECDPDPSLAAQAPIRRIRQHLGQFPVGGTLVFVGFYFHVGRWAQLSLAGRRIIVCNTLPEDLRNYRAMRQRISCRGLRSVEVAYSGPEIAKAIGEPGRILPSPIDLDRFRPRTDDQRSGGFRVGRVSRDHLEKHHEGAPGLYRRLISAGCAVRIMGGTVLRKWIPNPPPGLELLPTGAEDCATFLRDLDCFLYRTNDHWFETFGRVVFEAMATGLPVVAHRRGGYGNFLNDGEDILLFDTDDEAFELVMRLRADPHLRERLGRNARARVEDLYSQASLAGTIRYFLEGRVDAGRTDGAESFCRPPEG